MKKFRMNIWLACVAVALLTSCVTPTGAGDPHLYSPPNVAEEPTAFLAGSSQTVIVGLEYYSAFPFAIDGLRVENASSRWNMPVPIKSGVHIITAEFNAEPYFARVELELNAVQGEDYTIKFATDLAKPGGRTFCEFWIVDNKTGKTLTPVTRGNLVKKS